MRNVNVDRLFLSPQDLVNHHKTPEEIEQLELNEEVDDQGGYPSSAYEILGWIQVHGCIIEDDCPYTGTRQPHNPNRMVIKLLNSFSHIHPLAFLFCFQIFFGKDCNLN